MRQYSFPPVLFVSYAILDCDTLTVGEGTDESGEDEGALEHEGLIMQGSPLDDLVSRIGVLCRGRREEEIHETEIEKEVVQEDRCFVGSGNGCVEVDSAQPPDDDALLAELSCQGFVAREDEELEYVGVGVVDLAAPARFVAQPANPVEEERLERGRGEGHEERVRRRGREAREEREERREGGVQELQRLVARGKQRGNGERGRAAAREQQRESHAAWPREESAVLARSRDP